MTQVRHRGDDGLARVKAVRAIGPRRKRSALLVAVAVVVTLLAAACSTENEIPLQERRAQALNKAIMCPVCPGESIDQSQNTLAIQMRGIVRDKLEQGWSGSQIKSFFVERYGPSVLLSPPGSGFNLLAWVLPPVVVIGAGLVLFMVMRVMRRGPAGGAFGLGDVRLSMEERSEYFRRIEAVLERDAGGAATAPDRTGELSSLKASGEPTEKTDG